MSTAAAPRPRVARLLSAARQRRLTVVVAGSGHGKTTALRTLAPQSWLDLTAADRDVVRLAGRLVDALGLAGSAPVPAATGPDDGAALAEVLAADIASRMGGLDDSVIVLDDADRLGLDEGGAAAWQLIRTLCVQAPGHIHLVLSTRALPEGRGLGDTGRDVARFGAEDLAFTVGEVAALLDGDADGALAQACWSMTGGWPAAVVLVRDRLERAPVGDRLDVATSGGAAIWGDLARAMVDDLPPDTVRILQVADAIGVVEGELLAEVDLPTPPAEVRSLVERGLLISGDSSGLHRLSPVLAGALPESDEVDRWRTLGAGWLDRTGHLDLALACRRGIGPDSVRELVRRRGQPLIDGGHAQQVASALTEAGTDGDPDLEALLGQAHQAAGDWFAAIEAFRAAARGAAGGRLTAAAAWRFASLLYLCGDTEEGLAVLVAALEAEDPADEALVAGWRSSLLWSAAETDEARTWSDRAVELAGRSGSPVARAAAHTAAALVAASQGDRDANDLHYRRALLAATEADDPVQLARIRSNLSSRAFEDGDYRLSVTEADLALGVARGHSIMAGLALANKADALQALGLLGEARAAADEAIDSFARTESQLAGSAHLVLATIDRERGDLVKARLGFERAARLSDHIDDAHTAAFARAELGVTLAAEDPPAARAVIARALEQTTQLERPAVLAAAAWVELVNRVPEAAAELARVAEASALEAGDLRALAESWEVLALTVEPPDVARLEAALARWESIAAPIAALRCRLLIARCRGDVLGERSVAAELGARGVTVEDGMSQLVAAAPSADHGLRILTLGRFQVVRGGEVVPVTEWQSRKARDLLKLLIARRGRPQSREAVADALWPDEPGAALGNRLSVLLSTVRRVLDPDRSHEPDHFISADDNALAIRVDRVAIDVVELVDAVREARHLVADGQVGRALALLRQAERLDQGEFLAEDAFAEWAVDCREEALDAAQSMLRQLAEAAAERGDDDVALGHLRRLLERDAFDEQAWLALIEALIRLRRHGEARRQHSRYARRMAELDVAPVPLARLAHERS